MTSLTLLAGWTVILYFHLPSPFLSNTLKASLISVSSRDISFIFDVIRLTNSSKSIWPFPVKYCFSANCLYVQHMLIESILLAQERLFSSLIVTSYNCKFGNFRENFDFVNSEKRHVCDVKMLLDCNMIYQHQ